MSTVEKKELAFPIIQGNDPFAGFSSNSCDVDSEDPFASMSTKSRQNGHSASAISGGDPFAAFVENTVDSSKNPFLLDEVVHGPAPVEAQRASSGAATPVDKQPSAQSDEAFWPGNNTEINTMDLSNGTSRDSAALNSSFDVAVTDNYSCSKLEASEASSSREIPNIALDSDSGNITADVNEIAPFPNAVYGFIEAGRPNLQIPTVIFTEATIVSEKSSSFEASNGNSVVDEGQTRLLESTEAESSDSLSHNQSNIISLSASESNEFVQVDNLSTMNISIINATTATAAAPADSVNQSLNHPQSGAPTQAHDFFLDSESCQDEEVDMGTRPVGSNDDRLDAEAPDALPKPKTNRVFTSSPIFSRCELPEPETTRETLPEPMRRWKQEFQERIAAHVEQETADIKQLREDAKAELELWYKDRRTKIEAQHAVHLKNQNDAQNDESDDRSTWQKMASLAIDVQRTQKVDEKRKDTSRMKHLLQLLTVKAPIRNVAH